MRLYRILFYAVIVQIQDSTNLYCFDYKTFWKFLKQHGTLNVDYGPLASISAQGDTKSV